MSKPRTAKDCNLPPHWKVRIIMRGGPIIHVISATEPIITGVNANNMLLGVSMKVIANTEHGDTIGFIDWREASAISWRFAPLVAEISE